MAAAKKCVAWLRSIAWGKIGMGTLISLAACCVGCAVQCERRAGDIWSMGLSRRTVELRPLDPQTALAKESTQAAPIGLAIIPVGFEVSLGGQQQARGFVIPDSVTNRFRAPAGVRIGRANGWYFGFVHYRIPRENSRVQLLANTVKGCSLRLASEDPHLKIGVSRTTLTTVHEEAVQGDVEYSFSGSTLDFNCSIRSIASP